MKSKMVSYTMETVPRMTDERAAEIKAMIDSPDYEIDFSDIPELTDEQLKNAVRGTLLPPRQEASDRPPRRGRDRLAQEARQGLPVPHERHPPPRNASLALNRRPANW